VVSNSGGDGKRFHLVEIDLPGFFTIHENRLMNTNQPYFIILVCLLTILCISQLLHVARARNHAEAAPKPKTPQPLKHKATDDCPFCRAEKDKRDDPPSKYALKP